METLADLERHVSGRLVRRRGRQLGGDSHISHGLFESVDPVQLNAFWALLGSSLTLITTLVNRLTVGFSNHWLGRWHLLLGLSFSDVGTWRGDALGLVASDTLVLLPLVGQEVILGQLRVDLLLIT